MEHELKPGDVVQLKSGGPQMTIEDIGQFGIGSTHDQVKCVWFEGKKRIEGFFELPTLCKPEPARAVAPLRMTSDYR